MPKNTTVTTYEGFSKPAAPTNIKIDSAKIEGHNLVVKASWNKVTLHYTEVKTSYDKDGKVKGTPKKTPKTKDAAQYIVHWCLKKGSHVSKYVNTTSATFTFNLYHYYPRKQETDDVNGKFGTWMLSEIWTCVCSKEETLAGKGSFKAGEWGYGAHYKPSMPNMGQISESATHNGQTESVTFSWAKPNTQNQLFYGYRYFIYYESNDYPNHTNSKTARSSGYWFNTDKTSEVVSCTDPLNLDVGTGDKWHVHYIELWPVGPQGEGAKRTACHAFGHPPRCFIPNNGGVRSRATSYVVDTVQASLKIIEKWDKRINKGAHLVWTTGIPQGTNWLAPANSNWQKDGEAALDQHAIVKRTNEGKALTFSKYPTATYVDLAEDTAAYVAVLTEHDSFTGSQGERSNECIMACGDPKAPSEVSFDRTNKTISWRGNTQLPNRYAEVYVQDPKTKKVDKIGKRDNPLVGTNTMTWSKAQDGQTYKFGVRNFANCPGKNVGKLESKCENSGDDIVWTDAISMLPAAPKNFRATGKGRANLTWDTPPDNIKEIEVSWSDNKDAWDSTNGPKTYVIDHAVSSWIVEDEEFAKGGVWYFRVRFKNSEEYGNYASPRSLDMYTTPDKPIISASSTSIVPGGELVIGWTYENEDETDQEKGVVSYGTTFGRALGVRGTDLSLEVPTSQFSTGIDMPFRVMVKGKSSDWSEYSDTIYVRVRRPVAASFAIPEEVTSLPIPVTFGNLGDFSNATLRILSGMTYEYTSPADEVTLYEEGDFIEAFDVTKIDGSISPTFPLEGSYIAQLTVVDVDGNMAQAEHRFDVAWAEHAELLEAVDVEYDNKNLSSTILITSDVDWTDMDCELEVYRNTADGHQLIADGVRLGFDEEMNLWRATITDPYAPYSFKDAGYRVVKRLPNNHYDYAEFPYVTDVIGGTVIDFLGERLKLPFNNKRSDTWDKPFEQRRHLGGSVTGHWQKGVSHNGNYSADLVKLEDTDSIATARRLARHTGEAYVRGSGGIAFPCNVAVTTDEECQSPAFGMSLTCTQVDSASWLGNIDVPEVE